MKTREWGEFVYAPANTVQGETIVVGREEAHHLFHVRRVGEGETVFATTGEGMVYECRVMSDRTLRIQRPLPELGEPPLEVTLCMAMLKGDLNRDVADTAAQLGARSVVFFRAERSEGRLLPDKLMKLRRNAIESIKQCGRARLPDIRVIADFASALEDIPEGTAVFVADPASAGSERGAEAKLPPKVALLVGPEGGLTARELEMVTAHGAKRLHLGDRRLRAETAVAVGLSYLLARAGDFRTHR